MCAETCDLDSLEKILKLNKNSVKTLIEEIYSLEKKTIPIPCGVSFVCKFVFIIFYTLNNFLVYRRKYPSNLELI